MAPAACNRPLARTGGRPQRPDAARNGAMSVLAIREELHMQHDDRGSSEPTDPIELLRQSANDIRDARYYSERTLGKALARVEFFLRQHDKRQRAERNGGGR
jgi:hypothetical protein